MTYPDGCFAAADEAAKNRYKFKYSKRRNYFYLFDDEFFVVFHSRWEGEKLDILRDAHVNVI